MAQRKDGFLRRLKNKFLFGGVKIHKQFFAPEWNQLKFMFRSGISFSLSDVLNIFYKDGHYVKSHGATWVSLLDI